MGILDKQSKAMLVESMRNSICNVLSESTDMTAKQASEHMKYVNESATYEQLLNVTMNPLRESKYLPDYVLEGAVAVLHRACMTGRKVIGPNAITEGALKLHKETGAVITESMMDAALESVVHGKGLEIVGNIIKEQMRIMDEKKALTESTKTTDKPQEQTKSVVTEAKKTTVTESKTVTDTKHDFGDVAKKTSQPITESKKTVTKKACKKCGKGKCKCKK